MKGIQLVNTGDLIAPLTIGAIDEQSQMIILKSQPGEIAEYPTLGVGIDNYLNDDNGKNALIYAIRENFKMDNIKIDKIKYENGNLTIDAKYL